MVLMSVEFTLKEEENRVSIYVFIQPIACTKFSHVNVLMLGVDELFSPISKVNQRDVYVI